MGEWLTRTLILSLLQCINQQRRPSAELRLKLNYIADEAAHVMNVIQHTNLNLYLLHRSSRWLLNSPINTLYVALRLTWPSFCVIPVVVPLIHSLPEDDDEDNNVEKQRGVFFATGWIDRLQLFLGQLIFSTAGAESAAMRELVTEYEAHGTKRGAQFNKCRKELNFKCWKPNKTKQNSWRLVDCDCRGEMKN